MDRTDAHRTENEARRDLTVHPERPRRHEDMIATYLGALAYADRRTHETGHPEDEEPQPVDEPAVRQYADRRLRR